MGTNFYYAEDLEKYNERMDAKSDPLQENYDEYEGHIGKRSAAGPYCWNCNITLCKQGEEEIHSGKGEFYNTCPICGSAKQKENMSNSAAGRELGFANGAPKIKTGNASCSSFTWAMKPSHFDRLNPGTIFYDEYRRKYFREEMLDMLSECPVQFYNMIGKEFS
jgi:hypothetical protein